jgi:hypoxanthine phosphoribosyltransferase
MSIDAKEAARVRLRSDLLYTAAEINAVYDRMAAEIQLQLGQSRPIVLAVLTGGLIPAGQLLPRLDFLLELDYLHATRYRGETRGAGLHWITRPSLPLAGRTLLIVDDILDEGLTLAAIQAYCREQGAEKVYTAVLVEKRLAQRPVEVQAEFVGVEVDNRYVFGCGMDYHGFHRNLPGIHAVTGPAHKAR